MYCTNCGKNIPEDSKFCRYCGENFSQKHPAIRTHYTSEQITHTHQYIGFWRRFLAYMTDGAVLLLVNILLVFFLFLLTHGTKANFYTYFIGILVICTIEICITIGYFVFFWVKRDGQTLGDRLLAIRVKKEDGKPINFSTGILRYLGYILSSFLFCLGFIWIVWDDKKQGWHDKIAKTVVVPTHGKPHVMLAILFFIGAIIIATIYNFILNLYILSMYASAFTSTNANPIPTPYSPVPPVQNNINPVASVVPTNTPLPSISPSGANTTTVEKCDESGTQVIDITQQIQNDIDHSDEANDYWAIDNYERQVKVWQTGTSSYCAEVSITGTFAAIAGKQSPGNTGTLSGNEKGIYQANQRIEIDGDISNDPQWPANGTAPTLNYNCDENASCIGVIDWTSIYFPDVGSGNITTDWSNWAYTNGSHVWIDSTQGNSGDII